ncbi:hypothetical protein COOONC_28475 [Cooperia oncophora]
MNRWDGPQWGQENPWPQENRMFEPFQDAPEEEPQMRITHHFDKDSQTPQRVVTELFGNTSPEVIGHILGQKNVSSHFLLSFSSKNSIGYPIKTKCNSRVVSILDKCRPLYMHMFESIRDQTTIGRPLSQPLHTIRL